MPNDGNISQEYKTLNSINPQILELDYFKQTHSQKEDKQVFDQIMSEYEYITKRMKEIPAEIEPYGLKENSNLLSYYREVKELAKQKYGMDVDSENFVPFIEKLIADNDPRIGKDKDLTKTYFLGAYKRELQEIKGRALTEKDYDILMSDLLKQMADKELLKEAENIVERVPITPITTRKKSKSSSTSVPSLDRDAIVKYARKYALKLNPEYDHHDQDCTNFSSQCLLAGGLKMEYDKEDVKSEPKIRHHKNNDKWYYLKGKFTTYSTSLDKGYSAIQLSSEERR